MMSFFVSAGHSLKDTGAVSGAFKENLLCMKFRDALVEQLRQNTFEVIVPEDSLSLSETIQKAREAKCDINIDLHFNAGPKSANGAEVFFGQDAPLAWKNLVGKFIRNLCERLGQKCRGSKSETQSARKTLGFLRLPHSLLFEIEFMTNEEATKKLLNDIQNWAKMCAHELSFLGSSLKQLDGF